MTKTHKVTFESADTPVEVPTGTTVIEAADQANIQIHQPCGGQGRCGRCIVKIDDGKVRQRSSLRLSSSDIQAGYALACQSVIEEDITVFVPPQEKVERRLVTDLTARKVTIPEGYRAEVHQTIKRIPLKMDPPSMEDQTDDWSRLQRAIKLALDIQGVQISLPLLQRIGSILRDGDWEVTAILDVPK